MKQPLVSIIITNYNRKKYLKRCIESLYQNNYKNVELILVDDCSTDGSVDFVKDLFPDVKVIHNEENKGLAVSSNIGAKLAKGKYILFYNNDTIASPDMIAELSKVAEGNSRIGVCAPKSITYGGKNEICCGVSCDIFGYPCSSDMIDPDRPIYADAAIFIRRNVFEEIGGFDSQFFLYGEDIDLCWRVIIQGYEIVPVSTAIFRHNSSCAPTKGDQHTTSLRGKYLVERQTLRMFLKNYSFKSLVLLLPIYLTLLFGEMIIFSLLARNIKILRAYTGAISWNLFNIKSTIKFHNKIQKMRKISDKLVQKRMYKGWAKYCVFKSIGIPKISEDVVR